MRTIRIFYDCEFLERGPSHPIDLISIGMIRDDGAEYYAVSSEFDVEAVRRHDWLMANVWPYLPTTGLPVIGARGGQLDLEHPQVKPRAQIATEVAAFVLKHPDPQLWAYYGAYDHVCLAQLFGRMIDLPDGFPMFTRDLMQEISFLGVAREDLPAQGKNLHKAIDDARWNRDVLVFLDNQPA